MGTFGWRLCLSSCEMELEQLDNSRVAEVAGNNLHHDTTRTTAFSTRGITGVTVTASVTRLR